jgi:general secretion pathway protein D
VAHLEAELAAAPRDRPPRELPEEDRVGDLMRAGASYMAVRDYEKARESFEAVLAIAPENREAMRYLKELQDRRYVANSIERKATVAKMTAQVRDAWNPPQYKAIRARGPEKPPPPPTEIPLLVKMDKIIIESIEFRQANIHDVVEFLNKAAREGDKEETDESKKGVNIILNLNPGGQVGPAAAPAPAAGQGDIFNLGPAPGGGAAGGATYEITFSARYISLLSALKIITNVAGLKYLIEGNIVMIVPADYEPGEIVVKMYPVEPTFVERIRETAPARRERGGEFRPMETPELETGLPDLKAYFENMGVPFPKGSSITYNSGIGKVIVANTSENLAKFEQILAELNVVPKQVEIEARFVEVNETDLQELGLEWLLNDNWEIASKANGAPLSGRPRIQMNANASQGGFTRGVRFFGTQAGVQSPTVEPVAAGGGTLGRVLSIASVLTNPELGMVLHLLEQNGNADLLSAPKVTTRSGAEASIRVVTEYIYPTSFRVEGGQIQTGTAGLGTVVQETTVTPEDFETREVGVILQVLPEVSPDGTTINLTMTPSVVTEPIWWNYGSTVRRSDQSEIQLYMPQPFFKVRTLTTQISIYDGATVVMGGLMTEDVKKINDKIPVLGDVPLIGGLFRNAGERSEKKNLLIFVTAKLVDPAGQLIRKTETAAVPAPVPAPQP